MDVYWKKGGGGSKKKKGSVTAVEFSELRCGANLGLVRFRRAQRFLSFPECSWASERARGVLTLPLDWVTDWLTGFHSLTTRYPVCGNRGHRPIPPVRISLSPPSGRRGAERQSPPSRERTHTRVRGPRVWNSCCAGVRVCVYGYVPRARLPAYACVRARVRRERKLNRWMRERVYLPR